MDNIKKFEDFLSRMQGLLDNAKKQGHIIVRVEDLESTFPELKEHIDSEDEKIRKWLIALIKSNEYGSISNVGEMPCPKLNVLAWLEEQGKKDKLIQELGEYKVKYIQETLEKALTMNNKDDERIRKNCIHFLELQKQHHAATFEVEECIAWLEKQGDSIKIKKGKNYLCTKTHKYAGLEWIEGIKYYSPEDYSLVNQGCTCYCPKYSKKEHNNFFKEVELKRVEPKFKVGDWIITSKKHIWCVDETPETTSYLYRLVNQYGKVEVAEFEVVDEKARLWTIQDAKPGDVLALKNGDEILIFRNLDNNTSFSSYYNIKGRGEIGWSNRSFVPATKEQRDALMKAMADAGWEFDFEKKELKKIEQKHTPKHKVGDTIYYNSFGEVKSMIVANVVTDSTNNPMYEDENGSAVFEEDLVEHKPAWSEEDERMYRGLHNLIYSTPYCDSRKEFSDWLESLRPQSTWKPTEKQMETLEYYMHTLLATEHKEVLFGLYNDLKQLKESFT